MWLCIYVSSVAASDLVLPKFKTVTGGVIKFPYSLQPSDENNVYFETFHKISFPVWKARKSKITFFLRGFFSKDSHLLTFINRSKISFGVSYQRKLHKTFNVSASVKYDYDYRQLLNQKKTGVRANVSYFYYKSWWRNMPADHKGWFRQKS